MKKQAKYFFIALGVLILLTPVLYILVITVGLRAHAKEDRIVFEGKVVQEAINDYMEKYGHPPKKLEDLVPRFMESIPAFPETSRTDYHLSADGREWTLDLYWRRGDVPLIFRRTNGRLGPEDANRIIDTENGCYVLKAR